MKIANIISILVGLDVFLLLQAFANSLSKRTNFSKFRFIELPAAK